MKRYAFALALVIFCVDGAHSAERPNILWITAEDMSPTLGCYGDTYATTPHIDRLAEEGVRYRNAFATAPVCSPSRCCLITGCYPPSLGTHPMRSAFRIPDVMQGFPSLLRDRGYYTSNNVKTDYNTANAPQIIQSSWDESSAEAHWRNRAEAKPFFSVFNLMTSHQSRAMTWTRERFQAEVQQQLSQSQQHDPNKAPLPPYYPDTLVTRRVMARFYDCVSVMDQQVGNILRQLEDDGLADNTIVFFYSDHGSGIPRHKRVLLDSGLHVPLIIRFPEKYAHLAANPAGTSNNQLVSFVDFAPTVLRLAGLDVPQFMQGQAFLNSASSVPARQYVYGHRDRIDETLDLARSIRDKRYLYVRNFMPHLGHNQRSWWPDMGEVDHEFFRVAEQGTTNNALRQYLAPSRPVEELYDCDSDPLNLHNLVGSPSQSRNLQRLRTALDAHLVASMDTGFLPESYAAQQFSEAPAWSLLRNPSDHHELQDLLRRTMAAANTLGQANPALHRQQLNDEAAPVRYWGILGLHQQETLSPQARQALQALLQDEDAACRIEAAHLLARHGMTELALTTLVESLQSADLQVVLHATRTIELLGPTARSAMDAMRRVAERTERLQASSAPATFVLSPEQDLAMFCSFSANNFLKRMGEGEWRDLLDVSERPRWKNTTGKQVTFTTDEVTLQSDNKNLWIVHEDDWTDFELTAECRMPREEHNSGIGFRCTLDAEKPRGYQCEIAEELTGGVYAIRSGGWVWPRAAADRDLFQEKIRTNYRTGDWNHLRIRCEGPRLQTWVNGVLATDVRDGRHTHGRIALQHHGRGGAHDFRSLYIRKLTSLPAESTAE